ncbi:MAG: hypothetical protein K2X39_05385 [Silvanigrellaceae bacterium]|nr:hypothetical protein [Silvanigrellaceae bacterium]
MFTLNLNRPTVAQDVGSVVLSTAIGTGIGYLIGLCGKTNVLASTLIWGAMIGVSKATEVLADRFLGQNTRDGKVVKAIGNFLSITLSLIALRCFNLIGNGGLIAVGFMALGVFAIQLHEAMKPTFMELLNALSNSHARAV